MKYRPLIIFLTISSVFFLSIISIWKILATLQGLNLQNLNINQNFLLCILTTFLFIFIEINLII